jgi:ADP-ribose pyrophosphatase YjhB (NUDIX family)
MASLARAVNFLQLSLKALFVPVTFGARAFVEDKQGHVALIRHSYRGGWFLPGGGVDRHELPEAAVVREAREEAGVTSCAAPEFFGLYVQKVGWVTNVCTVYRLRDAEATFRKSLEVREMIWIDPNAPPADTSEGTLRRLAELTGKAAKSPTW